MKATKMIVTALLLFVAFVSNAQVGIGTATPASSAQLDVSSTTKGFLPPRMTYEQRLAIAAPDTGLMVWCKNCGSFGELQIFNGTRWTNTAGNLVAPIQMGDRYGGGIVYSTSDNGQHGYIAAPQNLSSVLWEDAAQACADYRGGGYTDWFFSTTEQVRAMFYFDKIFSPGSLGLDVIWGGTDEPNLVLLWAMKYGPPGYVYGGFSYGKQPVRPVRKF
ncbi:hypothetical protein QWZ08_01555 [Ferruginibacter paludis]|uniref:hypothetical protein n=1 Tax=Ferruginibacter paludis TaxID=1310417 RepID=UPI0025B32112|nr:hypothetical protein [Ferruginibacter paludis]MDN3654290.1 hypothetical protein [Ferruginibacter paludis]